MAKVHVIAETQEEDLRDTANSVRTTANPPVVHASGVDPTVDCKEVIDLCQMFRWELGGTVVPRGRSDNKTTVNLTCDQLGVSKTEGTVLDRAKKCHAELHVNVFDPAPQARSILHQMGFRFKPTLKEMCRAIKNDTGNAGTMEGIVTNACAQLNVHIDSGYGWFVDCTRKCHVHLRGESATNPPFWRHPFGLLLYLWALAFVFCVILLVVFSAMDQSDSEKAPATTTTTPKFI